MTILIVGLITCAIGFIFGLVFTHLSEKEDSNEEEVQSLNNEAVLSLMDRQVKINESLFDFYKRQVEANITFEHRIETMTRKLNALQQNLTFCPKVRDSFFKKEEDNQ